MKKKMTRVDLIEKVEKLKLRCENLMFLSIELAKEVSRLEKERNLMAKLASDKPQFFNPLVVMEAKKIRDGILKGDKINKDEMKDEYDFSQGVRGKDVKDRLAKLRKRENEK